MGLDKQELSAGFQSAGIYKDDHILVHSSLSSLGWIDRGAPTVIDALIEAVGQNGTVVFPTLTGTPADSPENPPVFDARNTKCWTGIIPEAARKMNGAIRSLHPTHSVTAFGKLSKWLTQGHELVRTPCGFGSPFDKIADIAGKIILIGVTQSANTSFHHAEELAGVPYVLLDQPVDITMHDMSGNSVSMQKTYLHRWGPKRDYNALEPAMIQLGIVRISRVGEADIRVIDAMLQRDFLLRKLFNAPLATLALEARKNWM